MKDAHSFLKIKREKSSYRPVRDRIKDYGDVAVLRSDTKTKEQASRCMDCGVPFCHWGCPAGNVIPVWNELVFQGRWEKAFNVLQSTMNFPEFTGRLCPAICEASCVLGANDDPVTIRENELAIIEYAFKHDLIKARSSKSLERTGKKVAVVGSGPAGLACADELNKLGHNVVVFEKDDKIGGILRYGIPDFKLEKWIIDRRLEIMKKEGVVFETKVNVGIDYDIAKLLHDHNAVCLAGGSRVPRDMKIEGRGLNGIYFAMDYLTQSNKRAAGERINPDIEINAKGRHVVVVGGGDTGSDCVGTAHRQGAASVTQIELLPQPPECRTDEMPWPKYPILLKTTSSHEEGGKREWAVLTKKFIGENGNVKKLSCVRVDFSNKDERNCPIMREVPGSECEIKADMVVLSMGFMHPEHDGLLQKLGVNLDQRKNVATSDNYMTSKKGVFSAGDMRRGQSLIVWAIQEGRQSAKCIDEYLV